MKRKVNVHKPGELVIRHITYVGFRKVRHVISADQ